MAKLKFSWNLPTSKWFKVLEEMVIVGTAAALTFLGENVSKFDFGQYSPVIVASLTILINYLRQAIERVKPSNEDNENNDPPLIGG